MFFQYTIDSRCEDIVAERSARTHDAHSAKPRLRSRTLNHFMNAEFLNSSTPLKTFVIREYSMRSLTYESEILNALSGV
jgi:hypothetical protein